MAITSRSSTTAKTPGQTLGTTPDATGVFFQSARNQVPFFVEQWITTSAPGDMDLEWLDVAGNSNHMFQVVPSGTLTATVQGSIDGGKTFYDLTPEVGAASITAQGFYRYRGTYEFLRFKASAMSAAVVVSFSSISGV